MTSGRFDRPEQLLRLLPEQTREHAFLLLAPDGHIRWWSAGAEHIFGTPPSDAVGQPLAALFTPEDVERGLPELELKVAKTRGASENDRWLVRSDGSRFWAVGATTAIRDERGELLGFAKVLRNRTDLKEQLESLRNQAEASEALNRRKDVFLSTLSHELRNPLAPLSNAVQILRMTIPSTPEIEVPLRIIERQTESIRRLVDDLLDLARIGVGKVDLEMQVVPLQEVLRRAVESTAPIVRERRHDLDLLVPPVPLPVRADPRRLEQVFVNLIHNAAKYTPVGGRIWVQGTTEGTEAVVHVRDTGIGISHAMLPHVFELFTQADVSHAQSHGGLGIGLSLVKDLVALHGGSVQARSDGEGKGSEFVVRLPLQSVTL